MPCTVTCLPCLHGDCLEIAFSPVSRCDERRIFVDSGFASTYGQTLRKRIASLQAADKAIDLFILTHSDSDHIGGILPFLREFGTSLVASFWYNFSPADMPVLSPTGQIGVAQGKQLRDYLNQNGKLPTHSIIAGQTHQVGRATLTILSPTEEDFSRYAEIWRKQEAEAKNASAQIGVKRSDHPLPIEALARKPFVSDASISNRSSISFLFQLEETTMLFASDAHPDVLVASLTALGYSLSKPLHLDLMQVPHHGSRGNTSPDLIDLINCRHFLVSSNAANSHHFPHKEALARIVVSAHAKNAHEPIRFYFPYADKKFNELFTPFEIDQFHLINHYPSADGLGIVLHYPH